MSFDDAFNDLIESHGVNFVHYRAMRCPIGLTDKGSLRTPDHQDHDCSNGFLYKKAGTIMGSFIGNSSSKDKTDIGLLDGSTVSVTFVQRYTDTDEPFAVSVFDRFYLNEEVATVINWQVVERSRTRRDKLQYPVVRVEHLVDSKGNEWVCGKHFDIEKGYIVWRDGHGPSFDPVLGKGELYTVRYHYVPFWYVSNLVREVRVARKDDIITGERKLERMPYAVILKREIIFENEQAPELSETGDLRDVPAPIKFGSR